MKKFIAIITLLLFCGCSKDEHICENGPESNWLTGTEWEWTGKDATHIHLSTFEFTSNHSLEHSYYMETHSADQTSWHSNEMYYTYDEQENIIYLTDPWGTEITRQRSGTISGDKMTIHAYVDNEIYFTWEYKKK